MTDFHARRLPHLHSAGHPIFITWRLHGSLPPGCAFPGVIAGGRAFVALDRLLDHAVTGSLYLSGPEVAVMVVDAIRSRDPGHYQLHRFVVMPNHVHMLITPHVSVSQLMESLQRFTAGEGNRMLGLTGQPFWQEERYDCLVRDQAGFARIARYIEVNPVTAGLAKDPAEYQWSSAWPISESAAGHQLAPLSYRGFSNSSICLSSGDGGGSRAAAPRR